MPRVQIEFINTCPCCDEHTQNIKNAAKNYGDAVEVKIYYSGKDVDYLKKYGMITRGTMIINGKKKFEIYLKLLLKRLLKKQ